MKRWKINSLDELYECIGPESTIFPGSGDAWNNAINKYYEYYMEIPKKKGTRKIYVIDRNSQIYQMQKRFKSNFLDNIMLSDRVFGFVKERNYFDYLIVHAISSAPRYYLRIDIKDFFGSINGKHIEDAFGFYVDGNSKTDIINAIKDLVLYENKLVQGTPVAPSVSNIVFRPLDIRIERYCDLLGVEYSRYADDLLFSTDREKVLTGKFIKKIEIILKDKSFHINYDKLRLEYGKISLNGFVVGNGVKLSRKKFKHINAMIFYLEKNELEKKPRWFSEFNRQMRAFGYEAVGNVTDIINILAGSRSFLISAKRVGKEEKYLDHCERVIKRIEKQIDKLIKLN